MGINPGNPAFGLPPAEDALVRQIKDLERAMRENLASVANSFKTTVERLDGAIADLQEVVNAQVTPVVSNGSGSGFYVSPSFTTVATAPLVIPAGFTRALVYASGQVTGGNNDALSIAKLYAHILINGVPGPDSIVSMVNVGWNTATAFASANLSGLTTGIISVSIAAQTSGGTTSATTAPWDNATLTAQAIFLR